MQPRHVVGNAAAATRATAYLSMLVAAKGKTLTLFWKKYTIGVKVAKKITLQEIKKDLLCNYM